MAIGPPLSEILACPKCKGGIRFEPGAGRPHPADQCRPLNEIRDDIPIMLIDEARPATGGRGRDGWATGMSTPRPPQPAKLSSGFC